jgi:acetoin utilization deacetylase AcuC-like enzyme
MGHWAIEISASAWNTMTLLYRDPRFLEHETGSHPERPLRLRAIESHLDRTWLAAHCRQLVAEPAEERSLARVHAPGYIKAVGEFALAGGGYLDADTYCCPRSYEVATLAAGAVVDAVRKVMGGEDGTAFCLVRPPGHHALADQSMGFCLFNNVAVGAAAALEEFGLDRVLIVDFDVHHGNGTQAMFWEDPRVGFLSIHRWPFYPGTGSAEERGAGTGLGTTLNLPITVDAHRETYLKIFTSRLQSFADQVRPQLVMVSAGFDAHHSDPLGSFLLETHDYATLTDRILEVAAVHAGGRVVSVLEGGYNPPVLAQCVEEHLGRLLESGGKHESGGTKA